MSSPINKDLFTETPCRTLDELLHYRDGSLTTEEKHRVEEHLLDCPLCSDALEGLQRVQSTDVIEEIRSAIQQPESARGVPPFGKYIAIAASLTAVVLLSWFGYHQFNRVETERLAVRNEDEKSVESAVASAMEESEVLVDTAAATVVQERIRQPRMINEVLPIPQPKQAVEALTDDLVSVNEMKSEEVALPDVEEAPALAEGDAVMNKPVSIASGAVYMDEQELAIAYLHGLKIVSYDYGVAVREEKRNTAQRHKSINKKDAAPSATVTTQLANDYSDLIGPPLLLYKKGQYKEAITGFDHILRSYPADQNAQFYKAMCYQHMDDYDRSIIMLNPVANDPGNFFMEDAMFYLAQSYVNTGNRTPAIDLYNNIIQNNSNYRKQAKEELHRIEGGK